MISVGQRLKAERIKRKLSLEEVSIATKIRPSFLEAIEAGNYHQLPSSAYAAGFVRNYVEYVELPEREMMAMFRRECEAEKEVKVLPKGFEEKRTLKKKRFGFQKTTLAIIALFVILIGYLIYQYRFALLAPTLEVTTPKEAAVVTGTSVVVSGKTDPSNSVYVNDELTTVDQNGNFKKNIDVFPGKSTITIKAVNAFSKETVAERSVEVK